LKNAKISHPTGMADFLCNPFFKFQFVAPLEIQTVGGGALDAPPIFAVQILEFPKKITVYCLAAM